MCPRLYHDVRRLQTSVYSIHPFLSLTSTPSEHPTASVLGALIQLDRINHIVCLANTLAFHPTSNIFMSGGLPSVWDHKLNEVLHLSSTRICVTMLPPPRQPLLTDSASLEIGVSWRWDVGEEYVCTVEWPSSFDL
jgi:hypothetical protein